MTLPAAYVMPSLWWIIPLDDNPVEHIAPRSKRELRNRANTNERQILDEVLPDASTAGVVIIPRIKPAIEDKRGKALALSSVYRMLARHG